jgi:hypothetical protein
MFKLFSIATSECTLPADTVRLRRRRRVHLCFSVNVLHMQWCAPKLGVVTLATTFRSSKSFITDDTSLSLPAVLVR